MRSAPAFSASATCSPRRAKSAARIEGASLTTAFCIVDTPSLNTCCFVLGFEDFDELLITPRYLFHGSVTGDLVRTPIDKRTPETRATDGETDESRDRGGSCKP